MDPDATLAEIRELLADAERVGWVKDGDRLAELISALDTWIINGGFLPTAWRR